MKNESEFPFERARRVTPEENQKFQEAISEQFAIKLTKRGKLATNKDEKYELISLKLHPKVLAWAKEEARKRGIGYQTVINEVLLERIS
ncbi:MAG: BrnA antitoxin family protein [Symploca sp. SIO2G7]|nr:BrnA antitoxin family protein [Symploca sp. SIO2G7]